MIKVEEVSYAAMTAKKSTKKCDARTSQLLFFLLIKPIAIFDFLDSVVVVAQAR